MIKRARQFFWEGGGPALGGGLIALSLLAARASGSATAERVFFFGRELRWGCLFRRVYGLPCPGCGLTRGVLLALDGHLREAFAANAAAPLVVFGLLLLSAALVSLAVFRRARTPLAAGLFARRVRRGVRAYGLLLAAALLANWLAELFVG